MGVLPILRGDNLMSTTTDLWHSLRRNRGVGLLDFVAPIALRRLRPGRILRCFRRAHYRIVLYGVANDVLVAVLRA